MEDDHITSHFTRRDLSLLAQSSPKSALRVITLIDYDCFYAQCESVRLGISSDVPLGVQQWEAIIALNYPARANGLARGISVEEARVKCPNLILQHVPTWREGCASWAYRPVSTIMPGTDKAALGPYRLESRKGLELIKSTLPHSPPQKIEKASVDEMYLDLSAQVHSILLQRYPALLDVESSSKDEMLPLPRTSVLNWHADAVFGADAEDDHFDWDDIALNIGSEIVDNIRREIFKHMRYTCSAGIARNKMLAKLASGYNKPNHQTVILRRGTREFLSTHKFTKIRGLGGLLGTQISEKFNTKMVSELLAIPLSQMKEEMGLEVGAWVFNVIRGEEQSEVNPRMHVQSMLSAKTFVPKIVSIDQAAKWLRIFVADLLGRLDELGSENHRISPTIITLNHHIEGRFGPTRSKQTSVPSSTLITEKMLFNLALGLLTQIVAEEKSWPCRSISLRIAGFQSAPKSNTLISSYFMTNDQFTSLGLSKTSKEDSRKQQTVESLPRVYEGDQISSGESESLFEAESSSSSLMDSESHSPHGSELALYSCPHCNSSIPAAEVLEHLDWHVALELSNVDESRG